MDFEKEYNLLWNVPAEARATGEGEAASERLNTLWWCVLTSARTIFEKNEE